MCNMKWFDLKEMNTFITYETNRKNLKFQNSVKLLTKVHKNNLQKKQCNYVLTHTVTDWFFRAITPTHTDAPIVSFFATCIKMGDNAQNIDIFDLNRAHANSDYTQHFAAAFPFAVHAFSCFVKFVCFVLCVCQCYYFTYFTIYTLVVLF